DLDQGAGMAEVQLGAGDGGRLVRRLGEGLQHPLQQPVLVAIRNHQVDAGEPRGLRRLRGGIAAGQHGAQARIHPPAAARGLARGARSGPRHGAGVDDVEVGHGERADGQVAGLPEPAETRVDLRLVQLAAQVGEEDAHGGDDCSRASLRAAGPGGSWGGLLGNWYSLLGMRLASIHLLLSTLLLVPEPALAAAGGWAMNGPSAVRLITPW